MQVKAIDVLQMTVKLCCNCIALDVYDVYNSQKYLEFHKCQNVNLGCFCVPHAQQHFTSGQSGAGHPPQWWVDEEKLSAAVREKKKLDLPGGRC